MAISWQPEFRDSYTFVILRCPFARLASVYLDKIVSKYPPAWNFYDLINRTIELDELSFAAFISQLQNKKVKNGDIHWRPQVDFLVYKQYDNYFCLENFSKVVDTLKTKIDLKIVDARNLTNHGINQLELVDSDDFSQAKATDIFQMKRNGVCPTPQSLYSDEIIAKVQNLYSEDINFYQEVIDSKYLMFQ